MSDVTMVLEKLSSLPSEYVKTKEEWQRASVERFNSLEGEKTDDYDCCVCKNKGFVAKFHEEKGIVYEVCRCKKTKEILKRAKKSGLGGVLPEWTFEKYIAEESWQKDIKSKAVEFCRNEAAKWFYIGGQVGSGKSHICTAICGYYIKAGYDVRYMIWAEDAKRLKAVANERSYAEMVEEYKKAEVLYIDDFLKVKYKEEPTAADINLAFEIINHRLMDKGKITIISSEKTLKEMLGYDEATMSRIYQKAGDYKINIGSDSGKNYRLRG